jgi:mannose-1-phosphate guanylyltransferase
MNALLLAAGLGKRLRPITDETPKCLVPILNKPLLKFWLNLLEKSEKIENIFINTHYLANQVEDFIKKYKSKKKINLVHEPVLLGTAGTLKTISNTLTLGNLFVAHADNLSLFDIKKFINVFETRPNFAEITMMTFITDNPSSCGIIKKNEDGIVHEFYEKKTMFYGNEANGAVFIFSENSLKRLIKFKNCFDISKDILPEFLGQISTFENRIYHRDIGTPESYNKANKEFKHVYEAWQGNFE